ncbi:hypothetical protein SNEBB_002419 [Seison nebaliae]|nr:hypothetical protein SNEBB_002419 [Seison nebaliae]
MATFERAKEYGKHLEKLTEQLVKLEGRLDRLDRNPTDIIPKLIKNRRKDIKGMEDECEDSLKVAYHVHKKFGELLKKINTKDNSISEWEIDEFETLFRLNDLLTFTEQKSKKFNDNLLERMKSINIDDTIGGKNEKKRIRTNDKEMNDRMKLIINRTFHHKLKTDVLDCSMKEIISEDMKVKLNSNKMYKFSNSLSGNDGLFSVIESLMKFDPTLKERKNILESNTVISTPNKEEVKEERNGSKTVPSNDGRKNNLTNFKESLNHLSPIGSFVKNKIVTKLSENSKQSTPEPIVQFHNKYPIRKQIEEANEEISNISFEKTAKENQFDTKSDNRNSSLGGENHERNRTKKTNNIISEQCSSTFLVPISKNLVCKKLECPKKEKVSEIRDIDELNENEGNSSMNINKSCLMGNIEKGENGKGLFNMFSNTNKLEMNKLASTTPTIPIFSKQSTVITSVRQTNENSNTAPKLFDANIFLNMKSKPSMLSAISAFSNSESTTIPNSEQISSCQPISTTKSIFSSQSSSNVSSIFNTQTTLTTTSGIDLKSSTENNKVIMTSQQIPSTISTAFNSSTTKTPTSSIFSTISTKIVSSSTSQSKPTTALFSSSTLTTLNSSNSSTNISQSAASTTSSIFSSQPSSLFGSKFVSSTNIPSSFGTKSVPSPIAPVSSAATPSLFGSKPVSSLFESKCSLSTTSSSSAIVSVPSTTTTSSTTTPSLFGTQTVSSTVSSLFGTKPISTVPTSLFASQSVSSASPSLFTTQAVSSDTTSLFASLSVSSTTPSLFGSQTTTTTTSTAPSLFGNQTTTTTTSTTPSLFGSQITTTTTTTSTTPSLFGSQTTTTITSTTPSLFGSQSSSSTITSTNIFGGKPISTGTTSLFGNKTTSSNTPSLFGYSTTTSSIFGGQPTSSATPSLFVSQSSTTSKPSIFGGTSQSSSNQSIFNKQSGTGTGGIFGSQPTSSSSSGTSIFGSNSVFGSSSTQRPPTNDPFGKATGLFGQADQSGNSIFNKGSNEGNKPFASTSIFGNNNNSGFNNKLSSMNQNSTGNSTIFGSSSTNQSYGGFGKLASDAANHSIFGQSNQPDTQLKENSGQSIFSSSQLFGSQQQQQQQQQQHQHSIFENRTSSRETTNNKQPSAFSTYR